MTASEESISKIKVTQIRGVRGRTVKVRRTLDALGLGRIGRSKVVPLNPAVRGMVLKVRHLVEVEDASS